MATLYRRENGTYWINCTDRAGRRRRKSLKTKSRAKAEELFRTYLSELHTRRAGLPSSITVSESVIEFLGNCRALRPDTISWYRGRLAIWEEFAAGDTPLHAVNQTDILDFKYRRLDEATPSTVRGNLRALSALFNWAVDEGYIDASPITRRARSVKGGEVNNRIALTREERAVYETHLKDTPLWYAYMFGVYGGLRLGELCALEKSDIRGGILTVWNKPHLRFEVKDHERRQVPVEVELEALLPAIPEGLIVQSPCGGRWNPNQLGRYWQKTMTRLALPPARMNGKKRTYGIRPHELRYTYASRQIQEIRTDIYTLARRMGHSSITTTERYLHLFKP